MWALIRILATVLMTFLLVGHANGSFIEGLGTAPAKPNPLAGLKCLLGSYTGLSEDNCPPPALPPSRTDVPPGPSQLGPAPSQPPVVTPSTPLQPAPTQSPQQSGPQPPGPNAPAVSPPTTAAPVPGPGIPTSGPAIPSSGPETLSPAPSDAPLTGPISPSVPAIPPPPPPVPGCSLTPANTAQSYGSYSPFGFNTDTATIGQLFVQPASCRARIASFSIQWPSAAVSVYSGRGYLYEFNPVTRQVVGSPLVNTAASFSGRSVSVGFAAKELQPATQYAFIVTTSGSWNGGPSATIAIDTVPLIVPLGQYPDALQGAVTLNSGNDLTLVSGGTYTLQPFNLHFQVSFV